MRKIKIAAIVVLLPFLFGCETLFTRNTNKIEKQIEANESAIVTLNSTRQDNAAAGAQVVSTLLAADPAPTQYTKVAQLANNYVTLSLGTPTAKTWLEWQQSLVALLDAAKATTKIDFDKKLLVATEEIGNKNQELAKSQEQAAKLVGNNEGLQRKFTAAQASIINKQKEDLANAKEEAKKDGMLRKGLLALGSLLILLGVGIGYLKKDLSVIKWFGGGAALCFGAAWLIGQWWFPWLIGGIILLGALLLYRKHALAGDLVGGISDVRGVIRDKLKQVGTNAHPEYVRAIKELKSEADEELKKWVTEHDGTAAQVDAIRREKGLIT